MHVNDFREDLEPTLAQWRAIAQGLCRLAGEAPPEHRAAALELILRLEAEPEPEQGAAAALAAAGAISRQTDAVVAVPVHAAARASAQRSTRDRTGARS
jgi:hypothetical protein